MNAGKNTIIWEGYPKNLTPSGFVVETLQRLRASAAERKNKPGADEIYTKYKGAFQATFQKPLRDFWEKITAFDVIKFDKWVKTPSGVSTYDFVAQHYGVAACDMLRELATATY